MSDDSSHDTNRRNTHRVGCTVAVLLCFIVMLVAIGSVLYLLSVAFTGFEFHRDKLGLRGDLVIKDANLSYSPGMDAVMWCRITVEAKSIDDVFDSARVDTSEFSRAGFEFRHATPITNQWWDVDERDLVGGEVEVGKAFMRVAYVNNGNGTLTVYIFWFEV